MNKCMNCGGDTSKGGHYVPPSLGEEGFFACEAFAEKPAASAPSQGEQSPSDKHGRLLLDLRSPSMATRASDRTAMIDAAACIEGLQRDLAEANALIRALNTSSAASSVDQQYAASLADAVENCRVTCKHEPSAFDLEQQGYDTIIRALRLFAASSASSSVEDALLVANDILRSCYMVAERMAVVHGTEFAGTNWGALHEQIGKALDSQLEILKQRLEARSNADDMRVQCPKCERPVNYVACPYCGADQDGVSHATTSDGITVPRELLRKVRNMCLRVVREEYAEAQRLVVELDSLPGTLERRSESASATTTSEEKKP